MRFMLVTVMFGLMIGLAILTASFMGCKVAKAHLQGPTVTHELASEAKTEVGMSGVTRSTEKRIMRQLEELWRKDDLETFTYIMDFQGRLWHVCDSIGFGIPAQVSNPQATVFSHYYDGGFGALQQRFDHLNQALFPPRISVAMWVICAPLTGAINPLYLNREILVSTFPLMAAGSYAIAR